MGVPSLMHTGQAERVPSSHHPSLGTMSQGAIQLMSSLGDGSGTCSWALEGSQRLKGGGQEGGLDPTYAPMGFTTPPQLPGANARSE